MSSSSRKYNYYYSNTIKCEVTATNGSGRSNAAKNNSNTPKETTRTTPAMPAKKEKPLSKSHELLSYGVKPWDPNADHFYEALLEARRKMEAQQDQDASKTDSMTGRKYTNSKWQGTNAAGSSSINYGNNNKALKATTSVNDQGTYGVKPWDSDAGDFCEAEARGKFESWESEYFEIDSYQDDDSD